MKVSQPGPLRKQALGKSSQPYEKNTSELPQENISPSLPRSIETTPPLLPSVVPYSTNQPPYSNFNQLERFSPQYPYISPQQQAPTGNLPNPYLNSTPPQYRPAAISERPLARGHLAQARFHESVNSPGNNSGYSSGLTGVLDSASGRWGRFPAETLPGGRYKPSMPRPPFHSPHALWVGNVPSDAVHQELWSFFTTQSPPSARGEARSHIVEGALLDLNSTGVESVHLITRSNCTQIVSLCFRRSLHRSSVTGAFVNYASDIHLQHAIKVTNGIS